MFIQVKAKSATGDFNSLVAVDHISNLIQARKGCQLVMKNGDILPITDDFEDVKKALEKVGQEVKIVAQGVDKQKIVPDIIGRRKVIK